MKLLPVLKLLLTLDWAFQVAAEFQKPVLDSTTYSRSSMLELHIHLVEFDSVSGNEANITKYLVSYLQEKGFTVEKQLVQPATSSHGPRENILAYLGKLRDTRILVSSHIDTVPPYIPYERRGEEIWGRGSVDDKGCIATQLTAVEALIAAGKVGEGDVGLLFVVDEEVGAIGMRKANDLGLQPESVIFGEPTELKLASGHKGNLWAAISATGKAGHSGYPWLGSNANEILIPVLYALQNLDLPSSEKYGNTTVNIGKIEGGVAGNVMAEHARAELALRIADGTPDIFKRMISDAIHRVSDDLEVTFSPGYAPVQLDSDIDGFETIIVNYGTDIPYFKGNHKRYLYGPGSILVAHSDHEHVTIADLETAVKGYQALIEHALR